jgi:peptidoglycan/xylan/chitin deacetylase (PgdA/CDA1 family)
MKRAIIGVLLLLCGCATTPEQRRPREIAITIDDLPVHAPYPPGVTALDVNRQMIAALKGAHVPVTAFVNAANVKDSDTAEALNEWRAAGFVLGNHTWSHPHLPELSITQFDDEVSRDEPILARLGAGTDWRWFRYPFLEEGKDQAQRAAARQLLARHGYRVAAVTMSFGDWAWTPAYARCAASNNREGVSTLETEYLAAAKQAIDAGRGSAHQLYGRDIPYVLLMHVSAMSAHMMPRVIALYREAGFRFVSLPHAERDPAYTGYVDLRLPPPASPYELAQRKGVRLAPPVDYSGRLAAICA